MRSWGLEDEVRAGGVEVEWRCGRARRSRRPRPARRSPVGIPTPRAERRGQPDGAGVRAAGPPRAGAAAPPARAAGRARVEFGTEVTAVEQRRRRRPRATLRDTGSGETRVVRARYLVGRRRCAQRGAACLGVAMRGPDDLARGRHGAVPRAAVGRASASTATASTPSPHPEAAGVFLPAGPGDRWLYGRRWRAGPRARRRTSPRTARPADRARRRRPRPPAADRAHRRRSRSPRSWPTASARAARSSSATPRTA